MLWSYCASQISSNYTSAGCDPRPQPYSPSVPEGLLRTRMATARDNVNARVSIHFTLCIAKQCCANQMLQSLTRWYAAESPAAKAYVPTREKSALAICSADDTISPQPQVPFCGTPGTPQGYSQCLASTKHSSCAAMVLTQIWLLRVTPHWCRLAGLGQPPISYSPAIARVFVSESSSDLNRSARFADHENSRECSVLSADRRMSLR